MLLNIQNILFLNKYFRNLLTMFKCHFHFYFLFLNKKTFSFQLSNRAKLFIHIQILLPRTGQKCSVTPTNGARKLTQPNLETKAQQAHQKPRNYTPKCNKAFINQRMPESAFLIGSNLFEFTPNYFGPAWQVLLQFGL